MALAHFLSAEQRWRAAIWSLATTGPLGMVFLVVKASEYAKELAEGIALVLGVPFTYAGPDPTHAQFFFGLYFAMTGLHALHLIGGIAAVTTLHGLNASVNMAIGAAKAALIALVFMHMGREEALVRLVAAAVAVWLIILTALTLIS